MSTSIPTLSGAHFDPDAAARALKDHGLVVITELVEHAVIDAVLDELKPYADATSFCAGEFEGVNTRRTGSIPSRSPTYRDELAMHPALMACGDAVFAGASCWKLSSTELIEVFPGQKSQALHRDQWKYDYYDFPGDAALELNGMWAMTDFTAANGATRVMPGSHQLANDLRPDASEGIPAEMPKGSLLLYAGGLYHGAGENRSDQVRIGLSLQHCVGWLQTAELFYLDCPPDQVRGWPDELLRFIGYRMFADSLGVYRDSEDPLAAVYPEREFPRGWVISTALDSAPESEQEP